MAGADQTPVYDGMLAAPKTYAFGTKIYIPSLGIGTVHDRGGAIVEKSGYDRIDVWMGYGDEGLTRALNWGMRMVEGTIYPINENLEDNLNYHWIPTNKTNNLNLTEAKEQTETETETIVAQKSPVQPTGLFKNLMGKDAQGEEVSLLQAKLNDFGYLNLEPTGKYGSETIEAVFAFQKEKGIVKDWNDYGAGYFGNKTREVFNLTVDQFNLEQKRKEAELALVEEDEQIENTKLLITAGLGKNTEGEDVIALQEILKELGYYQGEINGEYDSATIEAVFAFQKEHNVVQDEAEYGAGFFGQKTKQALEQVIVLRETKLVFGNVLAELGLKQIQPLELNLPQTPTQNKIVAEVESKTMFFSPQVPEFNQDLISTTLTIGDKGDDVKKLQAKLLQAGLINDNQITGYFGPVTEEALIKFQLKEGIIPSTDAFGAGVVGPMTRQTLNASMGLMTAI